MAEYVGLRQGEYWERTENSDYYCGGCGWKVTDHDSYCPECGGALHKAALGRAQGGGRIAVENAKLRELASGLHRCLDDEGCEGCPMQDDDGWCVRDIRLRELGVKVDA